MPKQYVSGDKIVDMTPEEEAAFDAMQAEWVAQAPIRKAQEIRDQRTQKLTESDWTQVADAPVDQAAWATYRQALRDVPSQAGFPWDVQWPVEP